MFLLGSYKLGFFLQTCLSSNVYFLVHSDPEPDCVGDAERDPADRLAAELDLDLDPLALTGDLKF